MKHIDQQRHSSTTVTVIILLMLVTVCTASKAQLAVGKWRDHFSYNLLTRVESTDDRVYASAANGLFYYDLDDLTVNRLNKNTSLNDVGIATFGYDPTTRTLVVAYNNSNLDFIKDDNVVNLSDIKRSNMGGDKRINNIRFHNRCAYLACGFGIAVVDISRNEIKETYYLGPEGDYLNINDIAFTDSLIIAATDHGIMYAPKESHFLNIVDNWTTDTLSLLSDQKVTRLDVDGEGRLLALVQNYGNDSTLYYETSSLNFIPWLTGNIRNIKLSQGNTVICTDNSVDIYDDNHQMLHHVGDIDWMTMNPNDAVLSKDGRLWVAHNWASLAMIYPDSPYEVTTFCPPCPASDDVFKVVTYDKDLFVCPGGHRTTFAKMYIPAELYTFNNNSWTTLNDPNGLLTGVSDVVSIAVNPKNNKQKIVATWGCGIIETEDNTVTAVYNHLNSDGALMPYTQGGGTSLFTGGVAFDKKGNLWITNSLTTHGLAVKRSNGSWNSFNTQNMVQGAQIEHILCDSINNNILFWGRANKIFVHDGESLMAYIDPNYGAKLETSTISSVVQDHDGNFWIGTNKGIKVIYNLSQCFQNGGQGERAPVSCSNILFNENGITEYLMAYESVTCIAVDGANRKWVGTSTGGLYLISANGLEQIEHFTVSNSPLLSDKILSLAILPWSGELFIATDQGLQSYRTTATYAFAEPLDDIHAFPNPVRPDYDGPIAIKGFTRNGIVHITDAAGHTVFSTHANGGQAIWYGRTNSGEKVASGVYYVFASSVDGSMRSVAKILIIK